MVPRTHISCELPVTLALILVVTSTHVHITRHRHTDTHREREKETETHRHTLKKILFLKDAKVLHCCSELLIMPKDVTLVYFPSINLLNYNSKRRGGGGEEEEEEKIIYPIIKLKIFNDCLS